MKRRWIIRGFFIGMLTLCVCVWLLSHRYHLRTSYGKYNAYTCNGYEAYVDWGRVRLIWEGKSSLVSWPRAGWEFEIHRPYPWEPWQTSYLGLWWDNSNGIARVYVPLWLPTALCVVVLLWTW